MNCNPLVTRKVLTGPMVARRQRCVCPCLVMEHHFFRNRSCKSFGKLGDPVAPALAAIFISRCCFLIPVSGTVYGDEGEHSLFAIDGGGSGITYI